MTRRLLRSRPALMDASLGGALLATLLATLSSQVLAQSAATLPVTPAQRSTAQQVAQGGVPLSELAPNAPDSHTVKRGDTLWDISKIFLRTPWRWPELWGMNLDQIRNPHLIYPGQVLYLDKSNGMARLRLAQQVSNDTTKLVPRVRSEPFDNSAIASVPMHLIAPFLNEAVVFNTDELASAPRVVASQEGRVMMGRGDTAYVRGELGGLRDWRVFRQTQPMRDPVTKELLGYEARFVGSAQYEQEGENRVTQEGKPEIVPATFRITDVREEVGVGDRLAPVPSRDFSSFAPHAPAQPVDGRIVSVYGDALIAGQNQIVALNRGSSDGMDRGTVLALWRDGAAAVDRTEGRPVPIKLPDERHGLLFVFSVFDRVSYALILQVKEPVKAGDRFSQP